MTLYNKYLERVSAGLCRSAKSSGQNRFHGKPLVFSTASVHENGDFYSAYSVPGTNVRGVIQKNKTSRCSQRTRNVVKYIDSNNITT